MVRSLGLVMAIVGVVFFLAQPPHSDAKKIRVVDPASDVQAFAAAAPAGAVPRTMPAGWRSTVSTFDPDTGVLRIGWVTPQGHYAEYAAASRPDPRFVPDLTDHVPPAGAIDVGETRWQSYRQAGGYSLVRSYGPTAVVLGTLRDTASLDELRLLAARLGA
jgi:hypothetical protein